MIDFYTNAIKFKSAIKLKNKTMSAIFNNLEYICYERFQIIP
jgi:hypothetical protein